MSSDITAGGDGAGDDETIQDISIMAGTAMADLLRSTIGPNGMDKMLVDSDGEVIVTNDGSTVLGEMDVEVDLVPGGRLLVELGHSQGERVGDGSTIAVVLAGELLREAEALFDQGLHATTIAEGYQRAAALTREALEACATEVDPADPDCLERVVEVVLTGKGTERARRALPTLVAEAAGILCEDGSIDVDDLVVQKALGGNVYDSVLARGVMIEHADPVLSGIPDRIEDAGIACINTSLDLSDSIDFTDHPSEGNVATSLDEVDRLIDFETDLSGRWVDRLLDLGVDVVICSEPIGERQKRLFAANDILAVQDANDDDFRHISRAVDAGVVADIDGLEAADVGHAEIVGYRYVGATELLSFEGCERPRSASLVLRGETRVVLDEVERAVRDCLRVVRTLREDPRVVPGGGAAELAVATTLRDRATETAGREQFAIEAFADAVEVVPRILAETCGADPVDTLVEARSEHAAGNAGAGVDVYSGTVTDMLAADVVEPLQVKRQSIEGAAEIAAHVVRVDDILPAEDPDEDELPSKE